MTGQQYTLSEYAMYIGAKTGLIVTELFVATICISAIGNLWDTELGDWVRISILLSYMFLTMSLSALPVTMLIMLIGSITGLCIGSTVKRFHFLATPLQCAGMGIIFIALYLLVYTYLGLLSYSEDTPLLAIQGYVLNITAIGYAMLAITVGSAICAGYQIGQRANSLITVTHSGNYADTL